METNKTIIFQVYYLGNCGCGFGREVSRKIELKDTDTLEDLQRVIITQSFKWTDLHLYSFFMDNKPYSKNTKMEYTNNPYPDIFNSQKPNSADTALKELALKNNQKFLFVFDFGDDHQFGIKVEGFGEAEAGKEYPLILEEKGKAPRQY
ncbi:hypothetical protein A3K73_08640 [Candidatus Pacearchaeota archaeon RBG_13_36_9]|nr:MAG: hypothetical protein A3K73_08640 [Candidatus Pacearchaeota archaeon RBG_13_36_9]